MTQDSISATRGKALAATAESVDLCSSLARNVTELALRSSLQSKNCSVMRQEEVAVGQRVARGSLSISEDSSSILATTAESLPY